MLINTEREVGRKKEEGREEEGWWEERMRERWGENCV